MYLLFTLNLSPSKPGYTSFSLFLGPFAPFQTLLVLIEAFPKYLEGKRDSIKRSLPSYGTNFCPSKCTEWQHLAHLQRPHTPNEYVIVPLTNQHRGKRVLSSYGVTPTPGPLKAQMNNPRTDCKSS